MVIILEIAVSVVLGIIGVSCDIKLKGYSFDAEAWSVFCSVVSVIIAIISKIFHCTDEVAWMIFWAVFSVLEFFYVVGARMELAEKVEQTKIENSIKAFQDEIATKKTELEQNQEIDSLIELLSLIDTDIVLVDETLEHRNRLKQEIVNMETEIEKLRKKKTVI